MPNRPSSPRDPLRRGGAAGLVDLWTTQRSVAHKLHNASSSSKRKRTNDVLSKPDKSECYRHSQVVGRFDCGGNFLITFRSVEALWATFLGTCAFMSLVIRFLNDENAATSIEYGLIAAGIALAVITVVNRLGTALHTTYSTLSTQLN